MSAFVCVSAWEKFFFFFLLWAMEAGLLGVNILNWTVFNCRAPKRMSARAREENTATMSIFTYTSRM